MNQALPAVGIPGHIAGIVQATPDKTALWDGETALSYRDLWARVQAIGGFIADRTQRGDRVLLQMPPGAAFSAAYLATQLAGCVAVPVNPGATADERVYVESDSRAVLALDATTDLPASGPGPDAAREPGHDDWSTILYTSGTTSRPKGVVHTHRSILANLGSVREAWGWTAGDHLVIAMPMYHTHGLLVGMTNALLAGSTVSILPKFDAEQTLSVIAERRATMFFGVPTMYARLVTIQDPGRWDLSSVRLFVSGSAALPIEVFDQFRLRFGHTILERYGMTETGMNLTNPLQGERIPGSVGFPFPRVDVRLVASDGLEASPPRLDEVEDPETPGEILVKGPNLFEGYLNRPDADAEAFVDGWFRTGDIATRDSEGRFRIVGRASTDIIKSRGYKIGALEIEDVLAKYPGVLEVAVIGVEHAEWGEGILAVVAPAPGASIDIDGLRGFCRQHLASYKCPTYVEIVDEIPKTGPGKYKKRDLIAAYRTRYR